MIQKTLTALMAALILLFAAGCGKKEGSGIVSGLKTDHPVEYQIAENGAMPNTHVHTVRAVDKYGIAVKNVDLEIRAKQGSELKVCGVELGTNFQDAIQLRTSEDGTARFWCRVNENARTGEHFLEITAAGTKVQPLQIRYLTGLRIQGAFQETHCNEMMKEPIRVTVTDSDGKGIPDVDVVFGMRDGSNGKKLLSDHIEKTDVNGMAAITAQMGANTGKYEVTVDVRHENFNRVVVPVMGIDFTRLIIDVLGGLAVFIFGMKLMSNGLHIATGEKMRTVLHFFSSNRIVAILAGTLVTTVLQTSSASTVIIIGFVNAGLLTLQQSIGIIFGANIGGALVSQLVAYDLSIVIMPCIILGLLLAFIALRTLRGWSETLLGFGFLFMGMGLMSSRLKPLGNFPSFIEFFQHFQCAPDYQGIVPFWALIGAICIGVLVTVIIQSSLATAGVVIALGVSGLLDFYTGVALMLGANIGTTVTAQLAAIPANRIAKQTALAHTLFNTIGVILMIPFFYIKWPGTSIPMFLYIVNAVTPGDMFGTAQHNLPQFISNAHILFNIITCILLASFIPQLTRLCVKILPIGEKKIKFTSLEPLLLDTPPLALEQTGVTLRKMLKKSWKMIDTATRKCFIANVIDEKEFEKLDQKESKIDALQYEITNYLTQIMRRPLTKDQAAVIPLLMHCTNDTERIADHTANIISLTRRLKETGQNFSDQAISELNQMHEILKKQAITTLALLTKYTRENADLALGSEYAIVSMSKQFEANHIARLAEQKCTPQMGVIFVEFLAELAKVSAHLTNIAERAENIGTSYTKIAAELHKRNNSKKFPATERDEESSDD